MDKGDDSLGGEGDEDTTEDESTRDPDEFVQDSQGGDSNGEADLPRTNSGCTVLTSALCRADRHLGKGKWRRGVANYSRFL